MEVGCSCSWARLSGGRWQAENEKNMTGDGRVGIKTNCEKTSRHAPPQIGRSSADLDVLLVTGGTNQAEDAE